MGCPAAAIVGSSRRRSGRRQGMSIGDPGALAQETLWVRAMTWDIRGKRVLVTGATSGIGLEAARSQYVSREAVHPERFQDSRRQFVFLVRGGEKALPEKEDVLEEVVDALQRRRGLQIRYRDFVGARKSVRIEPLSLAVYDHQLYVIGRPRGGPTHAYRFSRIETAETVGGTFPYPDKDSYDPERVFADSFGIIVDDKYPIEQIEMSLAPRWTSYVRSHRWHRSQESVVRSGRVHVRLRVRVCPELVSWILGFGPDARVIGPPRLKRHIGRLAQRMARTHHADGAS
ncbi:MAG: WYL domain-containing protein [Deltaproteobacteria bacterium]|nr:MAG: WYL domain-containing protein [Deltaproteobacteria bacterium]